MIVLDAEPGFILPEAIKVVIVEAAGMAFAVPLRLVERVTPPPPVTPLPLVPGFVDGLVGLGAAIRPQLNLARRLALTFAADSGGEGEVLVMLAPEGDYALRVDHVLSLATLEQDTVQLFDGATAAGLATNCETAEMVAGEFPWRGRIVLLLHPERVGLPDLAGGGVRLAGDGQSGAIGSSMLAPAPAEPHRVYVVARAGAGRYALPVEQVAEVLPEGEVTPVPGAPSEVLGLMQVRGRPLPVLRPATLAGGDGGAGVLMVLVSAAGRFALRVEQVVGIRRFPLSRIHAGAEGADGRAGHLIDADDRVIGLLDADRLAASVPSAVWRPLLAPLETGPALPAAPPPPSRSLLVVRIGGEWCALEARGVERLLGWRPPTPVPQPGPDLAGLVEIGADVLPLVDLRTAMGMPAGVDDGTALVVVRHGGGRWALAVDRIDRLATVPETELHPAEAPFHPLAATVTRLGERVVSLLDVSPLLGED